MHARRRWPWLLAAAVVLVAASGAAYAASQGTAASLHCTRQSCISVGGAHGAGSASPGHHRANHQTKAFDVTSTTPTPRATAVASNAQLSITFDAALAPNGPMPTLSPTVAGSWSVQARDRLVFTPSSPFVPFTKYDLTIPGGPLGVRSAAGGRLRASLRVTFTIANGSVLRLQQLLAELGYLPVSFNGPEPSGRDMATPQPGTFAWRWEGLPAQLTSQWTPGTQGAITKGAVMMFETENGLSVDGIAGPEVWTALLHDVASNRANAEPVTYVLVTKVLPEHLTAWVNGILRFKDIPVNTGVPGANTADGTFQVFEHVPFSDMKGTDVTGTTYTDPHVPWASYFNGGDALHGFPRATYGWPQSNGCVEMPISTAGALWPYTPIGTLVTVQGPTSGGTAPPPVATAPGSATTTSPPATTTSPPATTTSPPAEG